MENPSQTPEENMKKTTDNPENTSIVLPEEIINDIFSRLPVKPVFQLQCLSKNFSLITQDPGFIDYHLKQSARLRPSLIFNKGHDILLIRGNEHDSETTVEEVPLCKNFVLTSSETKFEIIGSCNGLCAVRVHDIANAIGKSRDDYYLWNPSTNKCDHLPSSLGIYRDHLRMAACCFGYCTESRVYKILRITCMPSSLPFSLENAKFLVEILTYGTDPVWRELDSRKYNKLFLGYAISYPDRIAVKGVVYWTWSPTIDKKNNHNLILTFDLEKEKFAWISCPVMVFGRIMQFRDSLAVCSFSGRGTFDLWVLENGMCNTVDHHDDNDGDVCNIVNESYWEMVYTGGEIFPRTIPLGCLSDHRLLLSRKKNSLENSYFFYDLESNEIKEVPKLSSWETFDVFNFVESLTPISASRFASE